MSELVSGYHHTAILIPKSEAGQQRAYEFYGQLLGLKLDETRPSTLVASGFWFDLGPLRGALHLMTVTEPVPPVGEDSTIAHLALTVPALAPLRQRLEAAGTEVWDRPGFPLPRFFARDPFGNVLEFIEIAP